jgi:hypothetical protein
MYQVKAFHPLYSSPNIVPAVTSKGREIKESENWRKTVITESRYVGHGGAERGKMSQRATEKQAVTMGLNYPVYSRGKTAGFCCDEYELPCFYESGFLENVIT